MHLPRAVRRDYLLQMWREGATDQQIRLGETGSLN